MSDLWKLSATEIATKVRTKEISATEVTQSHLDRIDAVNPTLNAIVQHMPEEALSAAAAVDAKIAKGEDAGPMAGVPVTIKVNIDQKGHATTNGLKLLKDLIATEDSPIVSNMRKAGAVIVGRTNTPAFSLRWFTKNDLHGQTLNPHGAGITPGGSSGGASSSVASGMAPVGHGTDIGGSIRYPAYASGLHGLRPTLGRLPAYNPSGADRHIGGQMMAVGGPLTRTMDDLDLSFRAMAAEDLRDPWWTPAPIDQGNFSRRAALCIRPDGMDVHPEIETALRNAADILAAAGWEIDEVETPPLQPAADINAQLWLAEMRMGVDKLVAKENEPDSKHVFEVMQSLSAPVDQAGLLNALQGRITHLRDWQLFLQKHSVLLCPISAELPFDQQSDVESADRFKEIMRAQLTQLGLPALGLPGLAVATGSAAGKPMGVQLIARRFREDILISAGRDIEAAFPAVLPIDPKP
ncbi:amidase family protein [Amylibacter sp. IMCC11727]|uniref:amidase family protein n=1 Tax=Amylibacter sp. IMCC11727 TaxID=3039851 RepID=UPI00244E4E00|nr:amidase family protein [Amylibacter sp. IMCC11727]WGI23182.1 amidase family protein [Amylibacter sp. IMCC11727]